ncbi:hypothetical protein BH20ACI2_BH20ACI2_01660 [soil metagenome]
MGVFGVVGLLNCGLSSDTSSNEKLFAVDDANVAPTIDLGREKKETEWKAAEFRSIKVGTDNRKKAIQILGKPTWTGDAPNESGYVDLELNPEIWDQFKDVDEMYTRVTVMSSKKDGRILRIEGAVPSLPVDAVLSRFGQNYQRKEYIDVLCNEEDPESLIMIEGKGDYSSIYYVYPNLGIAVVTQSKTKVISVQYRSEPIVPEGAKCPN